MWIDILHPSYLLVNFLLNFGLLFGTEKCSGHLKLVDQMFTGINACSTYFPLWTFSRPFQDNFYVLRDPRFLVYEKIL